MIELPPNFSKINVNFFSYEMSKLRKSSRKKKTMLPSPTLDAALKTVFLDEIQNPIVYDDFKSYFPCNNVDLCKKNHNEKTDKMYLMSENDSFPVTVPNEICKLYTFFLISGEILDEKFFRVALYAVATADDFTSKKLVRNLKCYLKLHPPCDENLKEHYKNVISENFQSHLDPSYFMFNLSHTLELLLEVLELPNPDIMNENNSILAFFDEMAKNVIPGRAEEFSCSKLCRILDIMLDIIHQDLYMCLIKRFQKRTKLFKKDQPILSSVAWEKSDVGCVNDHCKIAFKILRIAPEECLGVICRYIAMLAEVARISDQDYGDGNEFYPYIGKLCDDFASTLFSFMLENKSQIRNLIEHIQPLWLKMLVSKHFLKFQRDNNLTFSVIVSYIKENLTTLNNDAVLNLNQEQQEVLLCLITSYKEFYRLNFKVDSEKTTQKPKFVFKIDHQRRSKDEAAFSHLITLIDKISFDHKESFQLALHEDTDCC